MNKIRLIVIFLIIRVLGRMLEEEYPMLTR
jgi:hypothetical protein